METVFTPWQSLFGGALIGLAAVILMAANGRIAGVSGIVSRLLPPSADKAGLLPGAGFVIGLLIAMPLTITLVGKPAQFIGANLPMLIVAGLLVGFGSVLGNGCTSGHGVCGISRLSVRSVSATIVFMATAFITVFVLRHGLGG